MRPLLESDLARPEDRAALAAYMDELRAWREAENERIRLATADPFYGQPATAAMQADAIARCAPIVCAMYGDDNSGGVVPLDPPAWINPRPGPCSCGYCRGILTHKYGTAGNVAAAIDPEIYP